MRIKHLLIIILTTLILCGNFSNAAATSKSEQIKEQISEKKKQIQSEKESLNKLTSKERNIYSDLARTEKRIQDLQTRLEKEKTVLEQVRAQEKNLQQEYNKLEQIRKEKRGELRNLIKYLWPVYLENIDYQLSSFNSWEEAVRHFTWLASIYQMAESRLDQLQDQKVKLAENLQEQKKIHKRISSQIDQIQSTKDKLLQDKLAFLHRVQKIRAQRLIKEEQLAKITSTINKLQYKLKALSSHKIKNLKGSLPWPAAGEMIFGFDARSNPPKEGIGLKLKSKSSVKAISWGKVVYDDKLRGFGQVIILYHGDHFYSLYAYLAQSNVKLGQDIEKGESIGKAGFYPVCNGPGLYFELRSGKNPIDPEPWLTRKG